MEEYDHEMEHYDPDQPRQRGGSILMRESASASVRNIIDGIVSGCRTREGMRSFTPSWKINCLKRSR